MRTHVEIGHVLGLLGGLWLIGTLAAGCQEEFKPDPRQAADGYYLKGTSEYLSGNFDAALEAFAQVRKLAPDDPRLPAAIGEVHLAQGKLDQALEGFQAAARLEPRRATNWSRIGFILAQKGSPEEARAALEKALSFNSLDFNALEQLAELGARAGRADEAARLYAQAARASPGPSKGALYLKAVGLLEGNGKPDDARALLEDAARDAPGAAEVARALADARAKAADLAGAAAAYRQAAALVPEDPIPWELAGRIEARLGNLEAATDAYRQSLRVKERSVVHVALARIHLSRGARDQAKEELERALVAAGADSDEAPDETLELVDLLITFQRKRDALALLELLSASHNGQRDEGLQRRTARLAKEVGAPEALKAACDRLTASTRKPGPCP